MAAAAKRSHRPHGWRRLRSPPVAVVPDDETLAAMAKAIGHPARVAILRLLAASRHLRDR
jgi:hypothetical protein